MKIIQTQAKSNHFPVLDILRGLAALSVFAHHYYQQFYHNNSPGFLVDRLFLHLGAWGVAIFFALSGFCIQWARISEFDRYGVFSPQRFLVKRFFRIYPALIVSVLICYFVEFYYTSNLLPKSSFSSLVAHLTLTSSFFPGSRVAINNVLWSVVVECHFYLVYALLWRYFCDFRGIVNIILVATIVSAIVYAISIILFHSGELRVLVQGIFLASWWTWCLGALVAEMLHKGINPIKSAVLNQLFMLLTFAGSIGVAYLPNPWDIQARRFLLPIFATLFLYFLLKCNYNFSKYKTLILIGLVSYSLYLFHPLAILISHYLGLPPVFMILPTLAIGLAFAYASYYLVEVKGVAMGKKFTPS